MESDELQFELREAERAAAAPFMLVPLSSWWHVALLGLAGPLFALVTSQTLLAIQGGGTWAFIPSIAISLITILVVQDQRRRRGVAPKGKAPVELRPVYRWYFIGAALLFVAIVVIALNTSPWVSLPVSYLACLAGMLWFKHAYGQAVARIKARLA